MGGPWLPKLPRLPKLFPLPCSDRLAAREPMVREGAGEAMARCLGMNTAEPEMAPLADLRRTITGMLRAELEWPCTYSRWSIESSTTCDCCCPAPVRAGPEVAGMMRTGTRPCVGSAATATDSRFRQHRYETAKMAVRAGSKQRRGRARARVRRVLGYFCVLLLLTQHNHNNQQRD